MTPDELRALADALEPMARAPRFEDFDVQGFCAWVRACADAKPVGYVTANGLRSLRQDDATVMLYAHDYLIRPDHVALYTHPAPVAPQAEPKREPLTDEQIEAQIEARDALLDFISENGTASEGVQHYLDRYVRAALAAKDNGNAGE